MKKEKGHHVPESAIDNQAAKTSATDSENGAVRADITETAEAVSALNDVTAIQEKLDEMTKQNEDNYNRFLRMQADFENFKKRVAREREEIYAVSLEKIVLDLLQVSDNMGRAVSAFRADQLDSKYIDGVEMVYKQMISVLEKNGVKEIESENKPFDPNFHHAVMQTEAEEGQENQVVEVFQKGYILGSKVIRPTLVKVAH